ncbi:MAG TPA: gamma-glutamylcyclotransferase [Alphaproteobacteria bacterium]|nr:gamma-glutamylcyclotransferase [Alphaproteobacteria bacterium]
MEDSLHIPGLRLTSDLVARAYRAVEDPGPPPGRVPMSDEDYDRSLSEILARMPRSGDIWLFSYGSLIWNPACSSAERKPASAPGWHRSFCLKVSRFRGSPDRPGLMMALDHGGLCRGVAYRIPRAEVWDALSRVWRREMSAKPSGNVPRILRIAVDGQRIASIAFVVDREMQTYAGRLPLEEVAKILADACGHWGSGAEYLLNTVLKLEEHGIRDRNLWRLQALVAEFLERKEGG